MYHTYASYKTTIFTCHNISYGAVTFFGEKCMASSSLHFISMSVANFSPILALSQSAGKWDFLAVVEAEVA